MKGAIQTGHVGYEGVYWNKAGVISPFRPHPVSPIPCSMDHPQDRHGPIAVSYGISDDVGQPAHGFFISPSYPPRVACREIAQGGASLANRIKHPARGLRILRSDIFHLRAEIGEGRFRPFHPPHWLGDLARSAASTMAWRSAMASS